MLNAPNPLARVVWLVLCALFSTSVASAEVDRKSVV